MKVDFIDRTDEDELLVKRIVEGVIEVVYSDGLIGVLFENKDKDFWVPENRLRYLRIDNTIYSIVDKRGLIWYRYV